MKRLYACWHDSMLPRQHGGSCSRLLVIDTNEGGVKDMTDAEIDKLFVVAKK